MSNKIYFRDTRLDNDAIIANMEQHIRLFFRIKDNKVLRINNTICK